MSKISEPKPESVQWENRFGLWIKKDPSIKTIKLVCEKK